MSEPQVWRKKGYGRDEVYEHHLYPRPVEIVYDAYYEGTYLGPTTEASMKRAGFERVPAPKGASPDEEGKDGQDD
jgi:hypothetical protein